MARSSKFLPVSADPVDLKALHQRLQDLPMHVWIRVAECNSLIFVECAQRRGVARLDAVGGEGAVVGVSWDVSLILGWQVAPAGEFPSQDRQLVL
jgi:hypothetical protein